MPDYSKEQLRQLYVNLPKDLQEAVFSQQNATNVQEICSENGVTDKKKASAIAKNAGYVLLGLLPPNDFQKTLEKELELEEKIAKQITIEIIKFIFFPVRASLESLYKTEIKSTTEPPGTITSPLETALPLKKKTPKKRDTYREPIE